MDLESIQRLQAKYPGASWALWSDEFPDDGCLEEYPEQFTEFIESNTDQLNGSIILLSLNPSGTEPEGYENFHSPARKHFDHRLKVFIQDNRLEKLAGGYMTDIVPGTVDPNSMNVSTEDTDVERFLNLLQDLNHTKYYVICFGAKAFQALNNSFGNQTVNHPHNITSFLGRVNDQRISVHRVWHYSNYGANADKVPELERQLMYLNTEIIG